MSTQTNTVIENLISEHIRIEDTSETKLFVRKINKHPNAKKKYIWREIKISPHEACLYVGTHQPSTEEMLLDKVLTNKNFFDTCHGCGKLFHIDSLDNHLCNDCPTDTLKQAFNKHHFVLDSEIEGCNIPFNEEEFQVKISAIIKHHLESKSDVMELPNTLYGL